MSASVVRVAREDHVMLTSGKKLLVSPENTGRSVPHAWGAPEASPRSGERSYIRSPWAHGMEDSAERAEQVDVGVVTIKDAREGALARG